MFSWLPSPLKIRDSRPPQFGQPPYEWQPSRTVEVTYGLLPEDEDEYREFKRRADQPVARNEPSSYVARPNEPRPEKLNSEADFWWWARVNEELWILTEGIWSYFPDPLPYGLNIKTALQPSFRYLGHFGLLPDHWQNIPQRRA